MATTARSFDFELHTLSPKARQVPWLARPTASSARCSCPTTVGRAVQLTMAYAKARSSGVRIVENVLVTGFELTGDASSACSPTRAPSPARSWSWPPASGRATWRAWRAAKCRPARSSTSDHREEQRHPPACRRCAIRSHLLPQARARGAGHRRLGKGHAHLRRRRRAFGRELLQPNQGRLEPCCRPPSACRS